MSLTAAPRPRLDTLLCAALLVAGSLAFLGGGRTHPHVGGALGAVGSDAFYHGFAHLIVHTPAWEPMHALLLAGPLLWALGAAGIARLLPAAAGAPSEVGRTALLLGAAAWAVAFVLDGFIAPTFARTITSDGDPAAVQTALAGFRTNQRMVARFGTVSVVLVGASAVALGLALLAAGRDAAGRVASWRVAVGAVGVLLGLWPLAAAARGEFASGPFTTPYWMQMALALGLWFAALATALPVRRRDGAPAPAAEDRAAGPTAAPRS